MMSAQLSLAFSVLTFLLFIGLLYLHLKNRRHEDFYYASLFFFCATIVLFGQYNLELGPAPAMIIFWNKFSYLGIFGFLYTFPLFINSMIVEKLSNKMKLAFGALTLFCFAFIVFDNLLLSNQTMYYSGLLQARTGTLYPYFITLVLIVTIYFYMKIITVAKQDITGSINYTPLIIGLGIGIGAGIVDFVGLIAGTALIPFIRNPFVLGIFVMSVCFAWTFLSQYSWTLSNLRTSKEAIKKLVAKSNRNYVEFVELIAKTVDAKDHYTAGHSLRVMDYAVKIAKSLNLSRAEIELLKHACLLHDIGKISIPDGILNKPGPLTEEEREHIFKHPVVGMQILSTVSDFQEILDIIYAHHERVDGKGYPNGLTKDEIPFLARIIAVADTYDAMRSERPYRKARSIEEAVAELKRVRGSQLDKKLVDKFVKIIMDEE
jgi:putative nucleotidyltransferase with HDIG domain